MMINPITEIKADITTTKALQNELRNRLSKKRQAVHTFYEKREQAELQIKAAWLGITISCSFRPSLFRRAKPLFISALQSRVKNSVHFTGILK